MPVTLPALSKALQALTQSLRLPKMCALRRQETLLRPSFAHASRMILYRIIHSGLEDAASGRR
jgi:hypothetical protein